MTANFIMLYFGQKTNFFILGSYTVVLEGAHFNLCTREVGNFSPLIPLPAFLIRIKCRGNVCKTPGNQFKLFETERTGLFFVTIFIYIHFLFQYQTLKSSLKLLISTAGRLQWSVVILKLLPLLLVTEHPFNDDGILLPLLLL